MLDASHHVIIRLIDIKHFLSHEHARPRPSSPDRVHCVSQIRIASYNDLHKPFNFPPLMSQSTSQTPRPKYISPTIPKLLSLAIYPSGHILGSSRGLEYGLTIKQARPNTQLPIRLQNGLQSCKTGILRGRSRSRNRHLYEMLFG